MVSFKKAWEDLLADVLKTRPWGNRSRGGALLPQDRVMPPRTGDYGAGWAGPGLEASARLSDGGHSYCNQNFYSGRTWSGGFHE